MNRTEGELDRDDDDGERRWLLLCGRTNPRRPEAAAGSTCIRDEPEVEEPVEVERMTRELDEVREENLDGIKFPALLEEDPDIDLSLSPSSYPSITRADGSRPVHIYDPLCDVPEPVYIYDPLCDVLEVRSWELDLLIWEAWDPWEHERELEADLKHGSCDAWDPWEHERELICELKHVI